MTEAQILELTEDPNLASIISGITKMTSDECNIFEDVLNKIHNVKRVDVDFNVENLHMDGIDMKTNDEDIDDDEGEITAKIFVYMFYNILIDSFQTTFSNLIKEYKKVSKRDGYYDKLDIKKFKEVYDRDCKILIKNKKADGLPKPIRKVLDNTHTHRMVSNFPHKKAIMLKYLDNLEIGENVKIQLD